MTIMPASRHSTLAHAHLDVFQDTRDDKGDLASTYSSSDDSSVDTGLMTTDSKGIRKRRIPVKAIKKAIAKRLLSPSPYSFGKTIEDTRDDTAANCTSRASSDGIRRASNNDYQTSRAEIPLALEGRDDDGDLASTYSSGDDSSVDTGLTTDSKGFAKRRIPTKAIKKAIAKGLFPPTTHKLGTVFGTESRDEKVVSRASSYSDDPRRSKQASNRANSSNEDAISAFISTTSSSKKSIKLPLSSFISRKLRKPTEDNVNDDTKIYGPDDAMSVISFASATPTVKVAHVETSSKAVLKAKRACRKAEVKVRRIEQKMAAFKEEEEEEEERKHVEWHTTYDESSCTGIMWNQMIKLRGEMSRWTYCQDDMRYNEPLYGGGQVEV